MSQLWLVPPSQVPGVMKEASGLLEPAVMLSKGRYEIWDVLALILQGHMQLWASVEDGKIEACCVTQIMTYPRAKVLGFPFIGGKFMRNWLKFEGRVIEWAKSQGCTQLEGYDARHGAWTRVLKDWDENYRVMGKAI